MACYAIMTLIELNDAKPAKCATPLSLGSLKEDILITPKSGIFNVVTGANNNISIGDKFLCTKNTIMQGTSDIAYKQGVIYLCEQDNCITDDFGRKDHYWGGDDIDEYWQEYFVRVE